MVMAERIAHFALAMISGAETSCGPATDEILTNALPAIETATIGQCAPSETQSLLRALDGRYIAAGPSGAPTRGRPEILPTGRNFYSLDSRALPTPTAWKVGQASSEALLQRHVMEEGGMATRFDSVCVGHCQYAHRW